MLVLGMHRSGTSAFTRVINSLGAALPKTLIGSGKGNPVGHWEPARLVALHDQMLKEIGSRWDDWRAIDLSHLPKPRYDQIKCEIEQLLLQEYASAPLLVLKDPRICRFVPLYVDVLSQSGVAPCVVLPVRNPLAVMASLAERDGMTPEFSALLWLRHVLDAEAATRSLPRAIASYEALLADWRAVLGTVADSVGVRWPRSPDIAEADIAAFLRNELQHFAPTVRELSLRRDVAGWVKEAYRALTDLEARENEAARAVLDRVRHEFDAACAVFGSAMFHELAARESRAADALMRRQRSEEDLALALQLVREDRESLRKELSIRDQNLGALGAEVAARERQIGALRDELERRGQEISTLTARIASLEAQERNLATVSAQLSTRDAENADLRLRVARARMLEERLTAAASAKERELESQLADAAAREQRLAVDCDHHRAQARELSRLRQAMLESTSWRVTRPLRGLKRLLTGEQHAKDVARATAQALARRLQPLAHRGESGTRWLGCKALLLSDLIRHRRSAGGATNHEEGAGQRVPSSPLATHQASKLPRHLGRTFEQAQGKPGLNLDYVPLMQEQIDFSTSPLQLIAFYLPQFHPIPENDAWWGRGFTEWTNVSKAVPQFVGHYQPRLPGELGFYDLRLKEIQQRQIELAKTYGVYGFCFHYYWFGGKKLLHRPLAQLLSDDRLDMPFCLCWANENWTRRWDGQEHEVLIAQSHSADDDVAFITDLLPLLRDRRYIKVGDRPLLIVYRVSLLPDAKATAARWRDVCCEAGLPDPYLVAARSFEITDPVPYGFDAAVEFPPHQAPAEHLNDRLEIINPSYAGSIYAYKDVARHFSGVQVVGYPLIKTVMPGWDNEPRRPGRGHSYFGSTPGAYAKWLRSACQSTLAQATADLNAPPFVFVNAWNEWGEGAHLEPDRKYGYAYLHATANVLREFLPISAELQAAIDDTQGGFEKRSNVAVVLHLYYEELLDELLQFLSNAEGADVFVSVRPDLPATALARLRAALPNARVSAFGNRGRDIYPFLELLPFLRAQRYEICCKVHSKKSPSRHDGTELRRSALRSLLGSKDHVDAILARFREQPRLGLLAPEHALLALNEPDRHILNKAWLDRLLPRLGAGQLVGTYDCMFPAGSMFWFRIDALAPLLELQLQAEDFEDELGQLDGTLAHAVERLFAVAAEVAGFSVQVLTLRIE